MLGKIVESLATIGAQSSFATHRSVAPGDLKIEIAGVGRIRFPITATTARELCAVAKPARHGYKDQTRFDPHVRDTWEIPRRRISIDQSSWQKTLAPELDRIRRDLGLPQGCRLKAQLHNLLIYAPGQFFVTHQDSEKTDDMVGTLVVSLPAQFTGGAMLIEHHGETLRVGGSNRNLTFIAFYGDCRHQVRPVKKGYRIVLTYNLIVEGKAKAASNRAASTQALAQHIREFFEQSSPPRWNGDQDCTPPDRLVYLLDHEYTQRGLAWNRLKGADVQRAAALQEVARQLDCEILLALADVHETWACEEEYPDYGHQSRRRWHDGGNKDDEDDDEEDFENKSEAKLTDLLDSDVELRHWVGPDSEARSRPQAMVNGVGGDELCYTKPSVKFEPFESEYEGYMGNWGNTVDRWYHRAAVVLWPRERAFVIRARASALWAMGEIGKLLKARNSPQAAIQARRLLPFWSNVCAREERPRLLDRTLEVATKIKDEKIAAALLEPFTLTDVAPKLAPRVVDLLDEYGEDWCGTLLREWLSEKKHYDPPETRLSWLAGALPHLCRALCDSASSEGREIARWMLMEQWSWLGAHLKQLHEISAPIAHKKEASRLCKPLLALIESSRIAQAADLHKQMIERLASDAADLPTALQLAVLRAAHQRHRPMALPALKLHPVHASCTKELTTWLQAPTRAKNDWSIRMSIRCSCKLCSTLVGYLCASDVIRFEWPLAKEQRRHVHGAIDTYDLPVRHTTRRTGRPFTLVLEKTATLFERDAAERRTWQNDLAWLMETASCF
jgi:hypothetical protein